MKWVFAWIEGHYPPCVDHDPLNLRALPIAPPPLHVIVQRVLLVQVDLSPSISPLIPGTIRIGAAWPCTSIGIRPPTLAVTETAAVILRKSRRDSNSILFFFESTIRLLHFSNLRIPIIQRIQVAKRSVQVGRPRRTWFVKRWIFLQFAFVDQRKQLFLQANDPRIGQLAARSISKVILIDPGAVPPDFFSS